MKKIIFAFIPLLYLITLLFQTDLAMMGDLGRHLKLGELITQCLCVPQTNLFSYTHPDFPIVNHEWLAEVIFYFIAKTFGLSGLLISKIAIIITSAALVYTIARKKGSLFWVTIFSLLGITMFSMRFFVLPELFSYLFIALFLFIIEKYKTTKKFWLLWLLPLLELLWVNMHIYFIIGIAIYSFFVLETLIREKKLAKPLVIIGLLLIVVTLVNPSGLKGALLPFTFSHNYGFPVEENKSPLTILTPSSTNTNIVYTLIMQIYIFEAVVILFAIGLLFKANWKHISSLGNGATAAFLGLTYTRCISLFGLLGLIPLIQIFTHLEKKLAQIVEKEMLHIIKSIIVIIVGLVVFFHIKGLIEYKILHFGFEPSAEKAASFLKDNPIEGRIFNNYIIGNYLIYALYPKQVYIDARPEAYPAKFFDDYWRMMDDKIFFNEQVKKHSINAIVFNVALEDPTKSRPFLTRLLSSREWIPVYADGIVTILVKNNEINETIIEKYHILLPNN